MAKRQEPQSEKQQAGEGAGAEESDGGHAVEAAADEGEDEEEEAAGNLPCAVAEVLGGEVDAARLEEEEERGGGDHAHDGGTEHGEDTLDARMVLVANQDAAEGKHDDERREYEGDGGNSAAQNAHKYAVAILHGGGVANVGGTVDAYRTRCHLADCHDVGELLGGNPVVARHHLAVDQRDDGVATSEAEESHLEESDEKKEI